MNILSIQFMGFFLLLFTLYWLLPSGAKPFILITANLVFAMAFGWPTVPALLAVCMLAWLGGRWLQNHPSKPAFALLVVLLLMPLAFYKYAPTFTGFLSSLSNGAFPSLGWMAPPVGISYFTFKALLYLYDVYKHRKAEKNALLVFNYVSFFAMLVSGPIQPPSELLPQLKTPPAFSEKLAFCSCGRLLWGMFLKMVAADFLAAFQPTFREMSMTSGLTIILSVFIYGVQLYCDFAGYSQLAIGIAGLLGYHCSENFQSPYLSRSVSEFWRRWHISLSSMLRQLVYIPLGGSRKGTARWVLAIAATFAVSGIWHGAGFVFLLWGLWHAFCIITGKLLLPLRRRIWQLLRLHEDHLALRIWQTIATFALVCVGWLAFKVGSWGGGWQDFTTVIGYITVPASFSLQYIKDALVLAGFSASSLIKTAIIILAILLVDMLTKEKGFGRWFSAQKGWVQAAFSAICLTAVLFFGQVGGGSFIYFNF